MHVRIYVFALKLERREINKRRSNEQHQQQNIVLKDRQKESRQANRRSTWLAERITVVWLPLSAQCICERIEIKFRYFTIDRYNV